MREALEILQAAGADLILNGHDHHYERFAHLAADGKPDARAPREFVVGTGGAGLYALSPLRPGSETAISGQHGVLKLGLGAKGYVWGFYGLDAVAPLDAGEDSCLPKP